jgi:asparagine synthase (glutamine-hydrolysing)
VSPVQVGKITVFFAGRLDDRKSLANLARTYMTDSDAELVARIYSIYDHRMFPHLVGDYALAVHDIERSRFVIARDPMGMRRLFYTEHDDGSVIVATRLADLLPKEVDIGSINKKYVANYLTYGVVDHCRLTPYTGIFRVLPGHCLSWSQLGQPQERVFWNPPTEVHYSNQNDYTEHFKGLFLSAILDRMRGASSIGVDLSGGLDSPLCQDRRDTCSRRN